ncbi:DASH family cryptochrome [Undibacterium sp. Jales W-56]|uniref:DASH family cryptochrome n=1 Tax=Undibacterium sp. Jales W-56 TaxID=2897325 RepID=UPI0021D23AA5|nr:DASH family cryptochrome [Undibacterium sp. Jales W-56]MCU6434574.1 DASH family cryptochrome [Undibacterium sp. Jales W-56]
MTTVIYWFRNDLRLADNPALLNAISRASRLIPVFCHPAGLSQKTAWGFARWGLHRQQFLATALADLHAHLQSYGSGLLELTGTPHEVLPALVREFGVAAIFCEAIAAPEEEAALSSLRDAGVQVITTWQSSLLDPDDLPFTESALPEVFTQFRTVIERADIFPLLPLTAPASIPPLPGYLDIPERNRLARLLSKPHQTLADERSSFPYEQAEFFGGASAANAHLAQYLARKLPHSYKLTRNALTGVDYSTKFSPWLACGALSVRTIYAELKAFEHKHGANDGSYWIWFELLWRDYFRFLHLKYGSRLYRATGLSNLPAPPHDEAAFALWCRGETGEALVDAGMDELAATGYLSNRLRQIVASYLIHELACDWRAGAAWFEAQLIDYDVYSNQGNWLYIAGRGTDPRNGRRFNLPKQTHDHDADGTYRRLWLTL